MKILDTKNDIKAKRLKNNYNRINKKREQVSALINEINKLKKNATLPFLWFNEIEK